MHAIAPAVALAPVLLLAFAPGPSPAQVVDADFAGETRAYLARLEKLGFAGVVLVAQGDDVVLAEGYGLADRERGLPWTPETVSTVGSITKQFTAAAILRLQEQGRLDVQDPLARHLAAVPADKAGITLHHLLTHTAGLAEPDVDDFAPYGRDEYVALVLGAPLEHAPGEHYAYSNAGYSLLGAVIEHLAGVSYEQALRDLVLGPAGLTATGYLLPDWSDAVTAQGYRGDERWGTVLERPMAADGPYWALRANGGVHATAREMLKWSQALLDGRVLAGASREALWTPFVDESNGAGESWYGYGWTIVDFPAGADSTVRVVTHNGGNGILFADLAIVPEERIVAFLQCNVLHDFRWVNRLLGQIGGRLIAGRPYPEVPEVVTVARSALDRWAGTYELTPGGETLEVAAGDDALRVVAHGWTAHACVHADPGADLEPLLRMSREIDGFLLALEAGDFAPLAAAYGGGVAVEDLAERYAAAERDRVERLGPFRDHAVLGTAAAGDRCFTSVRLRYARGDVLRAYVWDRTSGALLGVDPRPAAAGAVLHPVAGGGFRSWDPATGGSVAVAFAGTGDDATATIGRGDGQVVARRVADASR